MSNPALSCLLVLADCLMQAEYGNTTSSAVAVIALKVAWIAPAFVSYSFRLPHSTVSLAFANFANARPTTVAGRANQLETPCATVGA